ncbi:MAG: hypothetical protein ACIALR_11420 [Blastopirellula sp. JB062]
MSAAERRLPFANQGGRTIPPFAVMAPDQADAVESIDHEGVLRMGPPTQRHVATQDAGWLMTNGPYAIPPNARGSCLQGEIVQALIRQDRAAGQASLLAPGAALGVQRDSFGLVAGGGAFRFLGYAGCPASDFRDVGRPQDRFRVGWVAPSYASAARYCKTEERRLQRLEPYGGDGLIQDVSRASLAGGGTAPVFSNGIDFVYRVYDETGGETWGAPELPPATDTDGTEVQDKGAVAIRLERAGVYQIGFTASCRAFNLSSSIDPLHLALLVERAGYRPSAGLDPVDGDTRLFLSAWQEGVYSRAESAVNPDDDLPYWSSLGGGTIVTVSAGDRLHVVNCGVDHVDVRYLNCWASAI